MTHGMPSAWEHYFACTQERCDSSREEGLHLHGVGDVGVVALDKVVRNPPQAVHRILCLGGRGVALRMPVNVCRLILNKPNKPQAVTDA